MNVKYWVTKEKQKLIIREMSTSHLVNCIHYAIKLKKQFGINWRPTKIKAIKKELENRPIQTFEF